MGKRRRKPVRQKGKHRRFAESMYNGGKIHTLGTRTIQIGPTGPPAPTTVKKSAVAIDQNRWNRRTFGPTVETKRISQKLYTINQMVDAEFEDPYMEARKREKEIGKEAPKWHEIIAYQDDFRKRSLCFYGPKAMWVDIEYCINKIRFSRVFNSSARAMQAHEANLYGWREYKTYRPGSA